MKPRHENQPKRQYRRHMTPLVEIAQDIELDPITGVMVGRGEGHRVWARKSKPDPDQRFQFYAQVPLARRIRAYVATTPGLTISQLFTLAAENYLASKGK